LTPSTWGRGDEASSTAWLFDEEFVRSQDSEFNYRLRQAGGRILLSPDIKSRYAVRSRPKALMSQYFQYGCWKVRVIQRHPQRMRPDQFVPPSFVFVLGTLASLSPFFRVARRLLALLLAVYSLGIGIATLSLARGQRPVDRRTLADIPAVFSLLHLGYGAGFLWGLLRFRGRWKEAQGDTCPLHSQGGSGAGRTAPLRAGVRLRPADNQGLQAGTRVREASGCGQGLGRFTSLDLRERQEEVV
jgi:hypothetical protein